jgi:predicted RNase H-like HicB family nuclease
MEKMIKEKLNSQFSNLNLNEELIKLWEDIEHYKGFLTINLNEIFRDICNAKDNRTIHALQDITLPFRDLNIKFSMELFNKDFQGRYTAYCPELVGCITEGKTKHEALDNLCYAISEVLILNYDLLNINPVKKYYRTPKVTSEFFIPTKDYQSYSYSKILWGDGKFSQFFLSKKHLLLKNPNIPDITITLNNQGFQQLTKHLIEGIAINN